jgi:membrane peptidoglycan carboxypeptidase
LVRNLQEGRYVVGASTISMQLVKNLLLHREKTLARKLQEVLLTWYMERAMDKRDILELYLNVIEYGPAVYGIRNAAQHYFGRMPSELSPAEGAFLATILPSPKRYHEYYERGALSTSGAERVRALLRRLLERGSCDQATLAYGLSEVEHFHFVKEGQAPIPRVLEGRCAPLPYQTGFESRSEWDVLPTNQVYEHAGQFP